MGTIRFGTVLLGLIIALALAPVRSHAQSASAPVLPQVFLNTQYSAPKGRKVMVAAGGDLQAALDTARPGDTVYLAAGATFVGNFLLREKSGSSTIQIRTSTSDTALPHPGTRVGPADAALMPKILSPTSFPALATEGAAHNYRLVGLELGLTPDNLNNFGLLLIGTGQETAAAELPHDIVVDRCYLHGNDTGKLQRGLTLNSASTAVIDSYISNVHLIDTDAPAIAGWNGPGPFKIVNNYIEGTANSILFGGADPAIPNLVPSDIEVRCNRMSKPLAWKADDPSYSGVDWRVKNLFELKNARRVLVDGNTIENTWVDAQNGYAVLFTVRNQDGTAPWSTVEDVTFTNNVVQHASAGINVLGTDDLNTSQQESRILVANNLFYDIGGTQWGGSGNMLQLVNGTDSFVVDHNTSFHTGNAVFADGQPHTNFVFTNNVVPHNDFGIIGTGTGPGNSTLAMYFPGATVTNNVLAGGTDTAYPPGNFFPATLADVGFVDQAAGDYRLAESSVFRRAGTDGTDLGADLDALEAALTSVAAYVPAPAIGGLRASATGTSATITWSTNVGTDAQVEYGTTASYGTLTTLAPDLATAHSVALADLTRRTTYHYRVLSRDYAGRLVVSGDATFTTAKK